MDKSNQRGMKKATLVRVASVLGMSALSLVLTGCQGIPIQSEKVARRQARTVAAVYRPHSQKPPLPVLTPESGLTNYLTYAMLNQPR